MLEKNNSTSATAAEGTKATSLADDMNVKEAYPSSPDRVKPKKKKEKVVITGDDILIEYVRRIKNAAKKCRTQTLPNSILYYMDKFLNHKVWTLNEPRLSPRL